MSDERLGILEQRVEHVAGVVNQMDRKVDSIAETVQVLARIEERQMAAAEKLAEGAQLMREHEDRLREVELAVPEGLHKRLGDIEQAMPQLKEVRRWIITGVLGVLGLVGLAVAHQVIK